MCGHIKAQCVNFDIDFGLHRSLQQDPLHDGCGAEEHRQGSDVVVQGRTQDESSSEEEVSSSARPITRSSPVKPQRQSDEDRRTPPTPVHVREEAAGATGAQYSQSDDVAIIELCSCQPCHRETNEEKLLCSNAKMKESSCESRRDVLFKALIIKVWALVLV